MEVLVRDWLNLWDYREKYNSLSVGVKATLWYTIANFIQKGFVFVSTPILTRVLSVGDYGTLMLYQSWFVLFSIFATLNLSQAAFSRGLVEYEDDRDNFMFSLMFVAKLTTIMVAALYFVSNLFFYNVTGLSSSFMLFLFSDIFFNVGIDFYLTRQRFEYKYKKAVAITLLSSILIVVISTLMLVYVKNNIIIKIISDNLIRCIFGLYCIYLLVFSKKGKIKLKKKYMVYGLNFTLPLIPHFLSHYVLNQSDRLMINIFDGVDKVAIYSVAYSISMIMFLITNAINQSVMPYTFQELHKENYRDIRQNTEWLFIIVAGMTILSILFAPELISILGGARYKEAVWLVPPIALSVFYLFVYSMFSNISFYYKINKWISLVSLIAAISNIILNYIFINLYGYIAAAYTTLFCYILLAVSHYILYMRVLRKRNIKERIYNEKMILMVSLVLSILLFLILNIYGSAILRYAFIVITMCFLVGRKKKIISSLIHK